MRDKVDVLIIGSGASGAAVAWSLAETKMHIVCLEQGDWMNPAEYPATRKAQRHVREGLERWNGNAGWSQT